MTSQTHPQEVPELVERLRRVSDRLSFAAEQMPGDFMLHDVNAVDEAAALLEALTKATPPVDADLREAVARLIDPIAFAAHQSLYDYCLAQGDIPCDAQKVADDTHKPDCDKAFAKADAILALQQSQSTPGAGDSLERQAELHEARKSGWRDAMAVARASAPAELVERLQALKRTSASIYGPLIDQTCAALAASPVPVDASGVGEPVCDIVAELRTFAMNMRRDDSDARSDDLRFYYEAIENFADRFDAALHAAPAAGENRHAD